jgi:hypothetical protein
MSLKGGFLKCRRDADMLETLLVPERLLADATRTQAEPRGSAWVKVIPLGMAPLLDSRRRIRIGTETRGPCREHPRWFASSHRDFHEFIESFDADLASVWRFARIGFRWLGKSRCAFAADLPAGRIAGAALMVAGNALISKF